MMQKINIFISYSWDDGKEVAVQLRDALLKDDRFHVEVDLTNTNRDAIRKYMDCSVRNCQAAIVVCTETYLHKVDQLDAARSGTRRPHAAYEYEILIEYREQGQIVVIPVLRPDVELTKVVPTGLLAYPAIRMANDFSENDIEALGDEIEKRVRAVKPRFQELLAHFSPHVDKPRHVEFLFLHIQVNESSVNIFDHNSEQETEEEQRLLAEFFDAILGREEFLTPFRWDRGQKYRTFAFKFDEGFGPTHNAVLELARFITNRAGFKNFHLPRDYTFTLYLTRGNAFYHPDPFGRQDIILDRVKMLPECSEDVFFVDEATHRRMSKAHMERFFSDSMSPIGFPLLREKHLTRSANAARITTHVQRKEWGFALEAAIRNHEQLNDENSMSTLKSTLEKALESPEQWCSLVAINSLTHYARCLCGMADTTNIFNDIRRVRSLVDKSVSRYSDFHESYLFVSGRSPLDPHIRRPLERKFKDFERTGTIHDDCCLCFARLGASGVLSNGYRESVLKMAQHLKRKKRDEYRSQAGQIRDWRYTSKVLIFASLLKEKEWADDILKVIVEASNWLHGSEWNSILERGGLIHSIAHYGMLFSVDLEQSIASSRLKSELSMLENEIKSMRPAPICLDGLIGLVSYLRSELCWGRRHPEIAKLVDDEMDYMRSNTLWDERSGTWGFERQRTNYRIELWLEYTEWQCQAKGKLAGEVP